jgi:glycosyltransferase involved in cell wall biosynthesis
MKTVLYASGQMPWPLDVGQKIATFSDLQYLSKCFRIDALFYIDPANVPRKGEYLEELRRRLPNVTFVEPVEHNILRGHLVKDKVVPFLTGAVRAVPFVVSKYSDARYAERLRSLLAGAKYDILYVDGLWPTAAIRRLPESLLGGLKVIYRVHDVFHETLSSYARELGTRPKALAVRIDARVCRAYERRVWGGADAVLPITRRLGSMIASELPDARDKLFYFPTLVEPIDGPPPRRADAKRVLYIGTVHFPPNLSGLEWFLETCWPRVLDRHPDATLDIVGRGGSRLLPVHESVRIHDYVEEISAFYAAASVFIVPLFSGSGVRLKILDALNHGVPVVSTRTGYMGLEVEEGRDLLAADDAEGFAAHIVHLLDSAERREELSSNGRHFIETCHSPRLAGEAVRRIVELMDGSRLS